MATITASNGPIDLYGIGGVSVSQNNMRFPDVPFDFASFFIQSGTFNVTVQGAVGGDFVNGEVATGPIDYVRFTVIPGFGNEQLVSATFQFDDIGDFDLSEIGTYSNISSFAEKFLTGADTLTGTEGDDSFNSHTGRDTLRGGNGDDTLEGGGGRDKIYGENDDDQLDGQAGRDKLFGGKGDDVVRGGTGMDILKGGRGADRFVFADGDSKGGRDGARRDIVRDFDADQDFIDLAHFLLEDGAPDALSYIGGDRFSGTQGEINFRNGLLKVDLDGDGKGETQIVLQGVEELTGTDWLIQTFDIV
ncbi:MAG: hypothetical protein Alpg2KO_12970 [Alphaproteobacteria bacterium]